MKKFFYFAAVALAFCVADARAAVHFQVGSVRVGPASDEAAAEAPAAPTPKKDEKKVKPAGDRHGETARENQDGRSDGSGEKSHGSDKSRASDKTHTSDKAHISDKAQEPASLSNSTASTNAPPITSKPSATSDAPLKPGTDTNVPVGSPVKTTTGAEATSDSNKIQSSSTTEPTANTANPLAAPATAVVSLASVYRIGIGDVLDIRMLNGQDPRQSTLYPVLAGGVLDFPLLHDPLTVTGMTTDELAAQLIAELRHRNINDRPQVRVSVREYASHAVLVSGMVNDPGTKILRREAIPLYVIVAEAQPKPEAGRAVIISHSSGRSVTVDLNDAAGLNTLVQSGDVVSLLVRPPEFFYVGGEIGSPGQKDFHAGMTLTQALLASGGVTRLAGEHVRVARQGADGRLVSADYNLREIEGGVVPDPTLQPGDRIEVAAAAAARRK